MLKLEIHYGFHELFLNYNYIVICYIVIYTVMNYINLFAIYMWDYFFIAY